jgi:hypothetical protein
MGSWHEDQRTQRQLSAATVSPSRVALRERNPVQPGRLPPAPPSPLQNSLVGPFLIRVLLNPTHGFCTQLPHNGNGVESASGPGRMVARW